MLSWNNLAFCVRATLSCFGVSSVFYKKLVTFVVKFLWSLRSPFAIPLNKISERRWFSRLFRGLKKIIGLWKIKKSRFRFLSFFVVCHLFVFFFCCGWKFQAVVFLSSVCSFCLVAVLVKIRSMLVYFFLFCIQAMVLFFCLCLVFLFGWLRSGWTFQTVVLFLLFCLVLLA